MGKWLAHSQNDVDAWKTGGVSILVENGGVWTVPELAPMQILLSVYDLMGELMPDFIKENDF